MMMLVLLATMSGCNQPETAGTDAANGSDVLSRPAVYTVNYPLYYFASRIAGDHANIVFPAPVDIDPAFWHPDESSIRAYQKADVVLLNGANYAKWVQKSSLPNSRLVNTSAAFSDQYLMLEGGAVHSHGPAGEHVHGVTDFNTWLDPTLAQEQARAVHRALLRLLPDHQSELQENLTALDNDLKELDRDLGDLFLQIKEAPLIASHPVYNYLARKYQLDLKSLHWEPEQMPAESEWVHLTELLKKHPATLMIWEASPIESIAEKLKELNLDYLVFYPCGNKPQQGDYLTVMRENIARLKEQVSR